MQLIMPAGDTQVWRVLDGFDYAEIHIRPFPKGVSVMADSSFGSYAHTWGAIGYGCAFEWLERTRFDYFMGKCAANRGKVFDYDSTLESMTDDLLQLRREGDISKDQAQEAYEELQAMESFEEEKAFAHEMCWQYSLVVEIVYGGDTTDVPICYKRCPQALGFWELWKHLIKSLAAKSRAERNVPEANYIVKGS